MNFNGLIYRTPLYSNVTVTLNLASIFFHCWIEIPSIRINQLHWVPGTICIGTNAWVLVRQRVNTQPHGHQLVVHVAATEGSDVAAASLLVAMFIVFNLFQRYCLIKLGRDSTPPLTGVFAGENKGVKLHVLSAVL